MMIVLLDWDPKDPLGVFCFFVMIFAWYFLVHVYTYVVYGVRAFGYDTGIYRHFVNGYFDRFFDSSIVPFGFSGYTTSLRFLGASTDTIIFSGYIFLSLLIAGLFYLVVWQYTQKKIVAQFALFLLATSMVQTEFFLGYYYRNYLALFFTLLVFYLAHIRSRLLWLVLIALSTAHALTALPVALTLLIQSVVNKENRAYLLSSGVLAAGLALVLNFSEYYGYLGIGQTVTGNQITGLFMGGKSFVWAIMWYLPLALFTLFTEAWKKYQLVVIFLVVNCSLIFSGILFYQRFFVYIDLVLLILAAVTLVAIWERPNWWIKAGVIIFLSVNCLWSAYQIGQRQPLISAPELAAISQTNFPNDARIITINPHYAPWLYGFTKQGIIAPGMFEHTVWDETQWNDFRTQNNSLLVWEKLQVYRTQPLYLFIGDRDQYFKERLENNSNFKALNPYLWQVL